MHERQVRIMLAAENLLKALDDSKDEAKSYSNDYDLGKVLAFCSRDSVPNREIRCADGQQREFSF